MALSFKLQLAYRLGYTTKDFDPRYNTSILAIPDYTVDDQAYLQLIMNKLVVIDAELDTNRPDAMALDVGGIKVDFGKSLALSRQEGSRLLAELANTAAIPMKFDKYTGRSPSSGPLSPVAVRNYF
jgi:hypothetical protein